MQSFSNVELITIISSHNSSDIPDSKLSLRSYEDVSRLERESMPSIKLEGIIDARLFCDKSSFLKEA